MIGNVRRKLRVIFSKQESGDHYVEIARGTWTLGREPELTGEAIPPEVLKGIEKQTVPACEQPKGSIRYARADVLYLMDFKAADESTPPSNEQPA